MLVVAACASAPEAAAPIDRDSLRELRWVAPGADTVAALTTRPVACAAKDAAGKEGRSELDQQRERGRLAFESPALLGGAAARMGLSCSSCHLNGRGNVNFFVEGVSGAPGTADVTSSLFSKVRGNGTFDPVPIPDLAARDGTQIRDRKSAAFREKVRGLIVEEFDGQPPPPDVFEAVLVYLDSLDVAHCADPSAQTELKPFDDYGAAFSAMTAMVTQKDQPGVVLFYSRAARERLERLHERFAGRGDVPVQLEALSASLAQAATARDGAMPTVAIAEFSALAVALLNEAPKSLYAPEVLRAALEKQPPR